MATQSSAARRTPELLALARRLRRRCIRPLLGHLGDHDTWTGLVDDVHALVQHLAAEHAGLPRLILGHSMGSLIAQQMLWQHPGDASGFVPSGSQGKPPAIATVGRGRARLERARLGKAGQSQLINALSFGSFNKPFRPCRTDFDWLSRDEAEVDAYLADPLCGFVLSTQSWGDLLDALPRLTHPDNLARIPKDMPVYALAGARDPVGAMGRSFGDLVDRHRAAWLTRLRVRLYPDGRHEMLHETNRAEVIGALLDWFDAVISDGAAPPGG